MEYSFLSISIDLFNGFVETLKIFTVTLITALPLGFILSLGLISHFKILKLILKTIIWIVRGTPLMLQLLVVYYGPGLMFGLKLMLVDLAVYIAFGLNYACYFAEIYRSGFESIPKHQYEAAKIFGSSYFQTIKDVIFIQVIKRIISPMSNEIMTLVKDTSLARVITYYEIIFAAQRYTKTAGLIWPLFYTGIYYLVFCGLLTILFQYFEKKLSYISVS